MNTNPDFPSLRAARNRKAMENFQRLAVEFGVSADRLRRTYDPDRCYCACGTDGPCEHKWDGEEWQSDDGLCSSVTCSRCGMTAMSHDLRYAP